jgi:hypothetical protein
MKNIFISFSGGLTSAFMTHYVIKNYTDSNILIAFANTGKERNETLDFVRACSINWNIKIHWIEYNPQQKHGFKNWFKIVDYESASRNGEPFEKLIIKEALPNSKFPSCSSRLKEIPLHNFVKTYFKGEKYYTAIGIRWDEKHRIKWSKAKENNFFYPLVTDFPVDKKFIHNFWKTQNFKLNLKSYEGNCCCCWKKSNRKLYTIAKENPHLFDWWDEMQKKHGKGYYFFRGNKTGKDLIEDAKHIKDGQKSKCDTEITDLQNQQLSFFDLDNETQCTCNL